RPFSAAPGLTTHAYLWTPPGGPNVLVYAPGDDADLDEIGGLGGVDHHYLSHRDEAGPARWRSSPTSSGRASTCPPPSAPPSPGPPAPTRCPSAARSTPRASR